MSRAPIKTFLLSAKRRLHQALKNQDNVSFVIGNESADLDSITSALLYSYIQSSRLEAQRIGKLFIPITNIPTADLSLRPELTALLQHAGVKPSELITLDDLSLSDYAQEKTDWTLVDHNAFLGPLGQRFDSRVTGVIDHHDDEDRVPTSATPRIITKSGSCSSLIVNHCREAWDTFSATASHVGAAHGQDDRLLDDAAYTSTWDAQAALLALGAILIDTANLQDEHKVTAHDRRAVAYLEALVHVSPKLGGRYSRDAFYAQIDDARTDLDALSVYDVLRKDYKAWTEAGLLLGTAAIVRPLEYLQAKDEDFNAALTRFVTDRNLPLLAVVTAYTTEEHGEFARQVLLVAFGDERAKAAAERFVENAQETLQLEEQRGYQKPADAVFACAWDQRNLAASRKQVAPLLRQAMREVKSSSKC